MAKKTKVAALKTKRPKIKSSCWIDKKGNVRCNKPFKKGQGSVLVKSAVGKDLVKARKAGKIVLYLKGKRGKLLSVWKTKNGVMAGKKRKMKRRKAKAKKRGRKRKVGRPKLSARKRKSSRCPKTRKAPTVRSAKACISRGKGRTIAARKVFNRAVRKLRKSKVGRKWLKSKGIKKLAKVGKAKKRGRKKARRRRR